MSLKLKNVSVLLIFIVIILFVTYISVEHEVEGWDINAIRNLSYYVKEELTGTIPEHFCKSQVTLLIVVTSAPPNKLARQAIRETWGKEKTVLDQDISLIFFIGNSLSSSVEDDISLEQQQYDDIIQGTFIESYYNLTLKSVLLMKTVADRCIGKAKYLLKIDDDMFLQVPKLMELIISKNKSENVLIGRMTCNASPIKNPFSKWYCPSYLYSNRFYPNFLSGTSYLMSIDLTKKLYDVALITPLIHLEDVYLTGICAEKAGIFPEYNALFTTGHLQYQSCQMKDLITMHEFSPVKMKKTFDFLNDSNHLENCNSFKKMFNVYNWIETILFMPLSRSKRKRICE